MGTPSKEFDITVTLTEQEANELYDNSITSMMEGASEGASNIQLAQELRKWATRLAYANQSPIELNIKLITDDEIGSQFVDCERIEVQDDGTLTAVVKAWRDKNV